MSHRFRTRDPDLAKRRKLWESFLKQAFDQMPLTEGTYLGSQDQEELND